MTAIPAAVLDYHPPQARARPAAGRVVAFAVATFALAGGVGLVAGGLLAATDVREEYAITGGVGFGLCVAGAVPLMWAVVTLLPTPTNRLTCFVEKGIAAGLSLVLLVGAVVLIGLVVGGYAAFRSPVPLFGGLGMLLAGLWFGLLSLFIRTPLS